jgi:hypothetical protein
VSAQTLTDEEVLVLARLSNEPQRKIGPVAEALVAKKMVKIDRGWVTLTAAGRKVRDLEFDRRNGFGKLVTQFWGQELY